MSLAAGRQILQYRLDAPIGEGGMGVVWRAHDTSLGRDVALKFLPDQLMGDPERLARMEREARLLAALNHPRIASIYGFHQAEGARFLAMEMVEGEDLAQRLARGAVPVAEAMPLALQIAEALEHAHEKGVIHRDLKPANIKLDLGGGAKVLDFGLAKAIEGDPASARSGSAMSHSPTITGGMTAANVLLGTAAYMSPEQARGQVADRRADIWAFGVVLWEMLTGRRLFAGETISDTLAAVLRSDPDFNALPAGTPARLRTLLRRCLDRDPRRRLRDIGEARITLDEIVRGVAEDGAPAVAPAPAGRMAWLPVTAAVVIGAVAGFATLKLTTPPAAQVPLRKFSVEADTSGIAPTTPVISPDGRYVASLVGGRVAIRDLSRLESRSFQAEPTANGLFWAPDSKNLGYYAGSRVIRMSANDGQQQVLCDTRGEFSGGSGACWTTRGTIIFSHADSAGILEISDRGGDPHTVMAADMKIEGDVHEPIELPGGRGIVFVSHMRLNGISSMGLWANGKRKVLLDLKDQNIASPRYAPSGHLLFHRTPNTPGIWAVPFSLAKLEITGDPFLVVADATLPSVSSDGTLCYRPGSQGGATELVWLSRQGGEPQRLGPTRPATSFKFAAEPGGSRVARSEREGGNLDLWIYDAARGTRTRLTFGPGDDDTPDWSPDGRSMVYAGRIKDCAGAKCWHIVHQAIDGSGGVDTLSRGIFPRFTPDGRDVIYASLNEAGTSWDLMRVPRDGSGEPTVLVRGNTRALAGSVSPDGAWLVYMSNESERYEVYMTRYPSLEGRWQVSNQGGQGPQWSPRGDRIYFSRGDEIHEVEVGSEDPPALGSPKLVLTRPHLGLLPFNLDPGFLVSRDGNRVLADHNPEATRRAPGLAIVQNWVAEFGEKE